MNQRDQAETQRPISPRLTQLEAQVRARPRSAAAALELAMALNAAQDHEGARDAAVRGIERLEEGEEREGGALRYELIYAVAHRDVRELGAHLRDAQKLAKKHPDAAWSHRNVALAWSYAEDGDRARRALDRALELAPRDGASHEVRALLDADEEPEALRRQLQQSIALAPKSFRLKKVLGDVNEQLGNTEEAREQYHEAIQREPLFVDAWHALGALFLDHDRDYESALRCFSHALAINPRCWDIYFTLTDYYLEEKRFDLARAEVERVLLLDPDASIKAEVENHLGYVEYLQGSHDDAVRRYRRAIALDPEFDSPWHNMGLVHVARGDFKEAVACFEKAVALDDDRSWSYTQLGDAHVELRSFKKARAYFETALEKSADEFGAHLGLAEIHRLEKRPAEQLEACLEALRIEPNDGNVRNSLAIAYECNKRPEEAISQYLEALRLDPLNRWAANNLGYLYEKLHTSTREKAYRDKAIEAWRVRLIICRDTGSSTTGARSHLLKLGVSAGAIDRLLRDGRLEETLAKLT